jgi:hypothetical protein
MRSGPTVEKSRPVSVLVRHFLREMTSLESIGTGGDIKHAVVAILSLLATPGYYVSVMAVWHGPRLALRYVRDGVPPLLWHWNEVWLLLVMSFVATSVLVAIQWRSLALDARDYRILGTLPLTRPTVLRAKLVSLLVVVAGLHLAVNTLAGLMLPFASPAGYLRMALAIQLTLLAQTVFVCGSVLVLETLVGLLLPTRPAQRVATAVQTGVLLSATLLLVTQDLLGQQALACRDTPDPVNTYLPLAWFMGLHSHLLGAGSAQVEANTSLAVAATLLALAAAIPCVLLGYRDTEGSSPRPAGRLRRLYEGAGDRLAASLPGRPLTRGVSSFVAAALSHGSTASLIARGWLVIGLAVAVAGFGGALVRVLPGHIAWDTPAALAPAIVLPFFALLGLRASAAYPVALEANWLFRVSEVHDPADYGRGVAAAALRVAVAPVLLPLFVSYAFLFGPGRALAQITLALGVALITSEWLFLGFAKIPFTCSYLPGKARLQVTWPRALAVLGVYCGVLPGLLSWVLHRPIAWLATLLLLAGTWQGLVAWRRRGAREGTVLVFDERPVPLFARLGLDD